MIQSSKVSFVPSEGRRLAGPAVAGASISESNRLPLKSCQANLFSITHNCLFHHCWKLFFSCFCLPPCSFHRCTATSWFPGPLGQLLWVVTGRRLLPPDLPWKRKAVLGCHGMWHTCYRGAETESWVIAGLHICLVILCLCTLPWP